MSTFSLIAVDVDGTLASPIMRISVCAWGVALAAILIAIHRYEGPWWRRAAASMAVLAAGSAMSPFMNRAGAAFIHRLLLSKPGAGIGFFGGPPWLASPFVALAITGAAALLMDRR